MHPWATNVDGGAVMYADLGTAVRGVAAAYAGGAHNVDVGCMQISLLWHGRQFRSLEEAFSPARNVAYGAALLTELRRESGS